MPPHPVANPESTLSPFVARDGENIAVQDWPLAADVPNRGTVLIVHGLGEHAGRYDAVARGLNDSGFVVRGYDQYGHGRSGGPRGALTSATRLLDDLADLVDDTRGHMPASAPLILLGHSMGGLVAAQFVAHQIRPVNALILSSPALDAGLNMVQKALLAVLPKIAPDLRIGNGLTHSFISHDPAVVAAYKADKLVHDRISARLALFIAEGGPAVVAQASKWKTPTLLLYAGEDRLVNPAGSRSFAAAAPQNVVTTQCFDALYHEIFNELKSGPVFVALKRWLDARF
ncbi:alpha/beta hydrolase [Rhodoferax sp. PAMC 29310]|uniref:alpha/beta hydrolase n=1 Tax=Rhodoferax sp. PAMC 29310 TaxID=2822760 RepID=UPI001B33F262|nr:alpha/beta hydrolase [Rhodoferax sp. PAMC 29310]